MDSRWGAAMTHWKTAPPGDGGTVGMTGKYDWDVYRMGQNGGDLEHFLGNWSLLKENAGLTHWIWRYTILR